MENTTRRNEQQTTNNEQEEKKMNLDSTKIENAIMDYFKNNEETFNECIEELNSWNGYLGEDEYFDMDMLDELYHGEKPMEILYRAFYGHDEDNHSTNQYGEKEYSEFNPNRKYFHFNGYGNLCSSDYKDYSCYLDRYFVNELYHNRNQIFEINYDEVLNDLFDQLDVAINNELTELDENNEQEGN